MAESIISAKSYLFANRIIKLEKFLSSKKQERIISKQLFRSGTSIGANVAEAVYAQSQADFINKHQIALKEASESRYWIRLLHDNEFIDENMYVSLKADVDELIAILSSIIRTSQANKKEHGTDL
ncbi:MAG: four helix bundle protein [Bacteroidaceae bacterium]|nr:four helix bundle protein [Bacteroidaceae bacterium]